MPISAHRLLFLLRQIGNQKREDRIAKLEEFINNQVIELDKMEDALKRTVIYKETIEKEYKELNVCKFIYFVL